MAKSKPAKRTIRKNAAPKKKAAKAIKVTRAASGGSGGDFRAYHVRIDHLTQGPSGQEKPADRLSVNSQDFLSIYVEAELPSRLAPLGEYRKVTGGKPGTAWPLDPPTPVGSQYRFFLYHGALLPQSTYLFHFADDLGTPKYEDQWEIVTIS